MAELNRVVLGPPPFSSPDPATIGYQMVPLGESGGKDDQNAEKVSGELKAADWVDRIEACDDQDELDEVVQEYAASGKKYKTVEDAVGKKQDELNAD